MKKNVFVALAAAFVLLFSACTKDISLPGTQWQSNYNTTATVEGIQATVNMHFVLNFTDATNYSLTMNGTLAAMGQTLDIPADTENGTYTFDGENGMFDNEQAFTYKKKDKTIIVVIKADDPDFNEMMGSEDVTLTFTQVK